MAYRITYEWQKEQELTGKRKRSAGISLGMLLVAMALMARFLIPESEMVFRELMHPLADERTVSAFCEMTAQIGEGMPVGEAVAVFCQEIIENGG